MHAKCGEQIDSNIWVGVEACVNDREPFLPSHHTFLRCTTTRRNPEKHDEFNKYHLKVVLTSQMSIHAFENKLFATTLLKPGKLQFSFRKIFQRGFGKYLCLDSKVQLTFILQYYLVSFQIRMRCF